MAPIKHALFLIYLISSLGLAVENNFSLFSPKYEGVYAVKLGCQKEDSSSACAKLTSIGNMVVFNNYSGLSVTFLSDQRAEEGAPSRNTEDRFLSNGFESDGATLYANAYKSSPSHPAREMQLVFKITSEGTSVKGWIRDTLTRFDIQISGEQKLTPATWLDAHQDPQNPISLATLVGNYSGFRVTKAGVEAYSLAVRSSSESAKVIATLVPKKSGDKPLDFVISQFYPQYGTMILVGQRGLHGGEGFSKLVLSVIEGVNGQVNLNGIALGSDDSGAFDFRFSMGDESLVFEPPVVEEPPVVKPNQYSHLSITARLSQWMEEYQLGEIEIGVRNEGELILNNVIVVAHIPPELHHKYGPVVHFKMGQLLPNEEKKAQLLLSPAINGLATVKLTVDDEDGSASANTELGIRVHVR